MLADMSCTDDVCSRAHRQAQLSVCRRAIAVLFRVNVSVVLAPLLFAMELLADDAVYRRNVNPKVKSENGSDQERVNESREHPATGAWREDLQGQVARAATAQAEYIKGSLEQVLEMRNRSRPTGHTR